MLPSNTIRQYAISMFEAEYPDRIINYPDSETAFDSAPQDLRTKVMLQATLFYLDNKFPTG